MNIYFLSWNVLDIIEYLKGIGYIHEKWFSGEIISISKEFF